MKYGLLDDLLTRLIEEFRLGSWLCAGLVLLIAVLEGLSYSSSEITAGIQRTKRAPAVQKHEQKKNPFPPHPPKSSNASRLLDIEKYLSGNELQVGGFDLLYKEPSELYTYLGSQAASGWPHATPFQGLVIRHGASDFST